MSEYIDRLQDEYRRAVEEGRSVMDRAASENRDLTPEESEHLDRAFDAVGRLKSQIDKLVNFSDMAKAADKFRTAAAPIVERATGLPPTDSQMLRLVLRGEQAGYESDVTRRLMGGDPEVALRALQSAGGSAVETSFADFVTVYERTFTPMLRPDVVSVIGRRDGSPLVLPRVTADPAMGGTVTAEAAGIVELDPTISSVTLTPFKYAITNLWSSELAQDETIGLEDILARTTGRELGLDIGAHLTTGTDTVQPNGFINAGANGGTATGTVDNTFFGPADIVDLFYGRAEPYRRVGSFQASNTGLAKIRKLEDGNNNFVWQPSLIPGQPETVLGRPIYENPAMAAVASASKSVAFGDFSRYYVVRVLPVRVESSIHYKFNTDQLALRTVERVDGDLIDTVAVAYLVSANA